VKHLRHPIGSEHMKWMVVVQLLLVVVIVMLLQLLNQVAVKCEFQEVLLVYAQLLRHRIR